MTCVNIKVEDKKKIIVEFLEKCNGYSDQMFDKYERQLLEAGADKQAVNNKIADWRVYKEFNAYAINELKGEQLDDWFDEPL